MSFVRPISSIIRASAPAIRATTPSIIPAITAIHHFPITSNNNTTAAMTARSKHSATQVKRLFKKNPARLRIQKRLEREQHLQQQEQLPSYSDADAGTPPPSLSNTLDPTVSTRVFPPVFRPRFLKNGWSAPPGPEVEIPEYPFQVERTGMKPFGAVGFLPVYSDVRIHGTKHTTIIRNVKGDIPAFLTELRAVLNLPIPKKIITTSAGSTPFATGSSSSPKHGGGEGGRGVNSENPIRIRAGGTIEVNGNRAREVRGWLAGLGF